MSDDKAKCFPTIGRRIKRFLDIETYQLNRTARINVTSDKVRWNMVNSLSKDENDVNKVDSNLSVSHEFAKEIFSLKTSTQEAPTFAVTSSRFESKVGKCQATVQDPKLAVRLCRRQNKYSVCLESTYTWDTQDCDAQLMVAYAGVDKLLIGAAATVERNPQKPFAIADVNVGVQFDRTDDQTFALTTENTMKKINVGAMFKVRDIYQGFAQVSYNTDASNGDDDEAANPLGYAVGVQRTISDTSNVRAVYRDDKTTSVMYTNNFKESNACARLGCNFDFAKDAGSRVNLEWKIVFGTGGPGGCCGAPMGRLW